MSINVLHLAQQAFAWLFVPRATVRRYRFWKIGALISMLIIPYLWQALWTNQSSAFVDTVLLVLQHGRHVTSRWGSRQIRPAKADFNSDKFFFQTRFIGDDCMPSTLVFVLLTPKQTLKHFVTALKPELKSAYGKSGTMCSNELTAHHLL